MRISTLTFSTNAVNEMDQLQTALAATQQQLSTGLQLQNAADNPAGMAEVNQLNTQLSASQQYTTNGNSATTNLQLEEQALTDATNTVQSVLSVAQQTGSTLTSAQRQGFATQLQQQLQQLVSIANTSDSTGNFLFSGNASTTQPFSQTGGTVSYNGSTTVNQVQISPDQFISTGDSGQSAFVSIPAGNGTFTTTAAATNTGSGSIDTGTVTNPTQWVPGTYTIGFTTPTSYQVTNSAGTVVASGTYSSGSSIAFNGVEATITGTPASGDQFTIAPAGTASVFSTISGLINTLSSTTLTSAQITTQIGTATQQLQNAISHFGEVQASVGSRVDAISAAATSAQTNQTTLQTSISQLSDVDYAAAVTQLSTQSIDLQAAQQSYAAIAKLSLFNYIS